MNGRRVLAGSLLVALASGACTGASPSQLPATAVAPSATAVAAASANAPSPATAAPKPTPIYDPAANASANIEQAIAAAKADGRPVLIDFGADWCPDCVALTRMMETEAFKAWLSGVRVVRVDVGQWDHNMDVSAAYGNAAKAGIPAVVLVSPDGVVLGSTADGRLASAASMTPAAVLRVLQTLGR